MRSKDQDLLNSIQQFIESFCDRNGYGPSTREVGGQFNISGMSANRYMMELERQGRITRGRVGYESNSLAMGDREMRSVAIVGSVPCGPLTAEEEYIEGYIKLPESLIGTGQYYFLKASGDSMIGAGIDDGDLVLIRQQETAVMNDIVVALVENENTLKRLKYNEKKKRYYLHPENEMMDDIYVDSLSIQGVAIKVFKDL
ncbi:MAG: transcriptional repressor LexA [Clostridiales bacterium]|nr:transcriptional repressor LexA [Clostridiales bacterium]